MTCAAPCCARPESRGLLCADDYERLGSALADLGTALTTTGEPSLIGWRTGGRGGGLASERDPVNLRALDAQRHGPPLLAAWASWLVGQRPELVRLGGARGDRALLARNFDWLVAQPEVVDLWCQLTALSLALHGNLPSRACACGGPVWVTSGGGWCSWCATAWTGRELLELARPVAA